MIRFQLNDVNERSRAMKVRYVDFGDNKIWGI